MIEIRTELPEDRERVFEIESEAFGRSDEARIVESLRGRAEPQLSLVALDGDRLVGHILFSPLTLEPAVESLRLAALGPVGVVPDAQSEGVGSTLIRKGLEQAGELGWQAVFLVGNPVYYARFGFALAGPMGFHYGDPFFDAVLQVVEITPGILDSASGRACFDPAFGQ